MSTLKIACPDVKPGYYTQDFEYVILVGQAPDNRNDRSLFWSLRFKRPAGMQLSCLHIHMYKTGKLLGYRS
jgi:hypothetical protein